MTTQRRVIYLMGLAMTAMIAGACTTSTQPMGTDQYGHRHHARSDGWTQQ